MPEKPTCHRRPATLYLSYDGMTDPLGRSQVIPYLERLSAHFSITILSFEKNTNFKKERERTSRVLHKSGIQWKPLRYTKRPAVLSTLWDMLKLYLAIQQQIRAHNVRLIHCRSYLTTLVALAFHRKVKIIFDMRGFWIDERVDGKIWDTSQWLYKTIFHYLKRKERILLKESDAIVSLTQAAVPVIRSWQPPSAQAIPITVIPCCTDTAFFSRSEQHLAVAATTKKQLGIPDHVLTIGYLGSIGTWYMLDEMLDFFSVFRSRHAAIFLFITPDAPELIFTAATRKGVPHTAIKIIKANREEVPAYTLMMDVSIFFILPSFSKTASSPTKLGELMSLGIPVICNKGVGDVERIVTEENCGILVEAFSTTAYQRATEELMSMYDHRNTAAIRQSAIRRFSVDQGAAAYLSIYRNLIS